MARLKYLDKADLAEKDQDLLARNINLFRALVHSPNAARAFSGLGGFIRHKSKADPRLRTLPAIVNGKIIALSQDVVVRRGGRVTEFIQKLSHELSLKLHK